MGTRGAFGWRANSTDHLTYNHFGSYPSDLGLDVLRHARTVALRGVGATSEAVAGLTPVDQSGEPTPEQVADLADKGITGPEQVSTGSDWYAWLRSTQGDPDAVLRVGYLAEYDEFANNSLFCEWAYVVNLDDGVLEVYRRRFQTSRGEGRYAEAAEGPSSEGATSSYWPVSLVTTFPLDDLPSDDEFVAMTEVDR